MFRIKIFKKCKAHFYHWTVEFQVIFIGFFPFLYFMIFLPKKKKIKESLSVVIQSNDSSYL